MPRDEERAGPEDWIAVVVLAVTAVLTAWCGFESSKWGGEMSIAFSKASSARVEAARHAAEADAARNFDLSVFSVYVQAEAEGDTRLREFVETRFTDHFAAAFEPWLATRPLENPDAPRSPFVLAEYQPPGSAEAVDAGARADEHFAQALEFNQWGDDYTLLTVLFALVLFFTAVSQRLRSELLGRAMLGGAIAFMLAGIVLLASFPKIV